MKKLEQELIRRFARWERLKEEGGSDPFYPDGMGLELTRNHILHTKQSMKKKHERAGEPLPEVYYRETPPDMPQDYMARPDEIRENARKSLERYKQDKNYRYLREKASILDPAIADKFCVRNILNTVQGLEQAIIEDGLVYMRRHEDPESYLQSFKFGAESIKEHLAEAKAGQLSIFDLVGENSG